MAESKHQNLRILLAGIWLLFTTSLAIWWMYFAMSLILQVEADVERHRNMLLGEGATLVALLFVGGSTLIYFILQEKRQAQKLRLFFSGFTHDVKTRLAGVILQTESLKADNRDSKLEPLIDRLITDTSRLQVQVENSLFVGGSKKSDLFSEKINLKDVFDILKTSWPQIRIRIHGNGIIHADRRAFENIVTNILHNSISHGQASEIEVRIEAGRHGKLRLTFADDGQGFRGDIERLGEIFYRHNPSSGSGLGLYTVRSSLERMSGNMGFVVGPEGRGFTIYIELPGELL